MEVLIFVPFGVESCPMWNQVGGGYSSERNGWVDASEFIDSHR
jgi:hypothetical protein